MNYVREEPLVADCKPHAESRSGIKSQVQTHFQVIKDRLCFACTGWGSDGVVQGNDPGAAGGSGTNSCWWAAPVLPSFLFLVFPPTYLSSSHSLLSFLCPIVFTLFCIPAVPLVARAWPPCAKSNQKLWEGLVLPLSARLDETYSHAGGRFLRLAGDVTQNCNRMEGCKS